MTGEVAAIDHLRDAGGAFDAQIGTPGGIGFAVLNPGFLEEAVASVEEAATG